MNVYKYFLLKHIDLINDIKSIITNYAKIRIITPPCPTKLFENNKCHYIYDNIIYDTGDSFMVKYVYKDTYFHVKK